MSYHNECPKCFGPAINPACKDCGNDVEDAVREENARLKGELQAAEAKLREYEEDTFPRAERRFADAVARAEAAEDERDRLRAALASIMKLCDEGASASLIFWRARAARGE